MTRGQQAAVAGTCLVAAVAYSGAVTIWAVCLFVLPGVAVAALLASPLAARRMSGMAIGVVGALLLGWAELTNIWTGTANGPVARSTVFAAGFTLITVVLAHSRWPALFLIGVAGVVLGAVVLGAAGEVEVVVVAAAVCAALTLGWIERSQRNWSAPPRRETALVVLSLLAGVVSVGVVLLQAQKDSRRPALVAQSREYPGIKPPWTDPLGKASPTRSAQRHPSRVAQHPASSAPKPTTAPVTAAHNPVSAQKSPRSRVLPDVLIGILLLLLVLALIIAARLLATRFAWRRVRRRLAAGAPADQITGAWAWTRMRLEACRLPLAVDVSPDVVGSRRVRNAVPGNVYTPLKALAAATTTAAFSSKQSLGAAEAAAAWTAAGRADESARELLTRRARARLAFRGPASKARSH